jgi:hypothetical protein
MISTSRMDRMRTFRIQQLFWVVFGGMLVTTCGHGATVTSSDHKVPSMPGSSDVGDRHLLAGEWEYEEGGVVIPLKLDDHGNGQYEYKGGKFLTGNLWDHTWTGVWAQQENDREGGFEVKLSPDYSAGEGRWWYTRIEHDTSPTKSGGQFKLIRVNSSQNSEHTSLFP